MEKEVVEETIAKRLGGGEGRGLREEGKSSKENQEPRPSCKHSPGPCLKIIINLHP